MNLVIEPIWVQIDAVIYNQQVAIERWSGHPGVRDRGLLESAMEYPANRWHYDSPKPSWSALAAAYAFAICSNHSFFDGNKRIAFATAYAFLRINGFSFEAPEKDVEKTMKLLAAGKIGEAELATWFAFHMSEPGSS